MKVALVHEYLNQFGGAERLVQVLLTIFPGAPVYTLFYDADATGHVFEGHDIRTSFLQKIPFVRTHHHLFPLLMPVAIEQFDFSEFDTVISISASFAKGIVTPPHVRHICYCLTPPRFLWDDSQRFADEFRLPWAIKKVLPPLVSYLRLWDRQAAHRVDEFWTISQFVRSRIKKYYQRDAQVIYPPVHAELFTPALLPDNYFLAAGRLVAYKRFDIVIEACNQLQAPLIIAGTGPELERLRKIAGPSVTFRGLVSDQELAHLYAHARAFIFPQEEDFGITPLEAMASGRPVIAFKSGGALETVIEGTTGLFFQPQTKKALVDILKTFNAGTFSPEAIKKRAQDFSTEVFRRQIHDKVSNIMY